MEVVLGILLVLFFIALFLFVALSPLIFYKKWKKAQYKAQIRAEMGEQRLKDQAAAEVIEREKRRGNL